ncbi:MAG: hypothetical protein HQK55_16780 [Deltaproteobacteria bacterium]|nr:hypothetical protein [Deltaproteobacteria bacterium]
MEAKQDSDLPEAEYPSYYEYQHRRHQLLKKVAWGVGVATVLGGAVGLALHLLRPTASLPGVMPIPQDNEKTKKDGRIVVPELPAATMGVLPSVSPYVESNELNPIADPARQKAGKDVMPEIPAIPLGSIKGILPRTETKEIKSATGTSNPSEK